jgi:hypothetical protein
MMAPVARRLQYPHGMPIRIASRRVGTLVLAATLLGLAGPAAGPVAVRYPEGIAHGFLVLRTLDGKHLADGDLFQTSRGDQVTSRMVLRFHDGSIHEENAVFTQRGHFRLVSDRLVQKGPTFPMPLEVSIDAARGMVDVRYEEKGQAKSLSEHLELPADLGNGFVATLIKNLDPAAAHASLSLLATSPKPRLVRLDIAQVEPDAFAIGETRRKARRYVIKVDLGGVAGVVAPLIGKQPPDTSLWLSDGDAPTFVKSEGPFYVGGPSWRLELGTPSWVAP